MDKEKKSQNQHDKCVKTIAEELQQDNWQVKANVEGWEKPAAKGKIVPDVEAQKGCLRRICEVLTEEDYAGGKTQYAEIKNYCDEYDFHMYIIDKDGNRKQIDPQTFGKTAPKK